MKKIQNFLILFGVFLCITVCGFFFLYQFTSTEMVKSYTNLAKGQMSYAMNQLEAKLNEVELLAASLVIEEPIRLYEARYEFENENILANYELISKIRTILNKGLFYTQDIEAIHIYWVEHDEVISTQLLDEPRRQSIKQLAQKKGNHWANQESVMYYTMSAPYLLPEERSIEFVVVIEMKVSFLRDIMAVITDVQDMVPFIRMPDGKVLGQHTQLDQRFDHIAVPQEGQYEKIVTIDGINYQALAMTNQESSIQLMSYFEVERFTSPVKTLTLLTLGAVFLILSVGMGLASLFYVNIVTQLKQLIYRFQKVENGDLSIEHVSAAPKEFMYVFEQFNHMVTGINRLLTSLDNQYKRYELAVLKQLQSQINPHFLSNSLFYIVSVSDQPQAVEAMSMYLAEYYRYAIKPKEIVLVEDEIDCVRNYLNIIAMRKSIDYTIHVSDEANYCTILALLIQPLLENAVEHGIEAKQESHHIDLTVLLKNDRLFVYVEDDGPGMSQDDIEILQRQLDQTHPPKSLKVGLWNTHQRLKNYDATSQGIHISSSDSLGGLRVSFSIKVESESYECINCR